MTDDAAVVLHRFVGLGSAPDGPAPSALVLLHHAAGSADSFRPFLRYLPADWTILAAQLPARVGVPREAGVGSLVDAVQALAVRLVEAVAGPFAVFGHCLGAIVGYELSHELLRHGRPPVWLGVSGSPAPHAAVQNLRRLVPEWSRSGLLALARSLGGMPEHIWQNEVLAERILRTFHADLRLLADHRSTVQAPLPVPLSVFGGAADPFVNGSGLRAWAGVSSAPATVRLWPGGHFYLYDNPAEVCARVLDDAVAACGRHG